MTGLLLALAIALVTGVLIAFAARLAVPKLAPLATALLLGLAGYAWQGSPGLAGAPTKPASKAQFDEALATKRHDLGEQISAATKWLVISDALARQGNSEDAANVLVAGLRELPRDPNMWVGLGNALVIHGEGNLSPAARYSFRKALALNPASTSANYFYGLALAQSGEFESSRDVWGRLAVKMPADSKLREELIRNIALLNALMKRRDAMARGETSSQ